MLSFIITRRDGVIASWYPASHSSPPSFALQFPSPSRKRSQTVNWRSFVSPNVGNQKEQQLRREGKEAVVLLLRSPVCTRTPQLLHFSQVMGIKIGQEVRFSRSNAFAVPATKTNKNRPRSTGCLNSPELTLLYARRPNTNSNSTISEWAHPNAKMTMLQGHLRYFLTFNFANAYNRLPILSVIFASETLCIFDRKNW